MKIDITDETTLGDLAIVRVYLGIANLSIRTLPDGKRIASALTAHTHVACIADNDIDALRSVLGAVEAEMVSRVKREVEAKIARALAAGKVGIAISDRNSNGAAFVELAISPTMAHCDGEHAAPRCWDPFCWCGTGGEPEYS